MEKSWWAAITYLDLSAEGGVWIPAFPDLPFPASQLPATRNAQSAAPKQTLADAVDRHESALGTPR